ncbi:hypothetical protein FKG94_24845 [Exilibacterium tricleocarpae]|uniref:DUF1311 domain-containing protein n=1 Tax=Exilibacterium tricleocarpae TaxID=2591008 RepID=A0A545SS29_9GAMM|nr:hypothetical protein [Exilibacterium tricleocarpae]TQV67762.1 hypothetical protein FKG94_24845 [Exilibacterium tricleocarpae]
MKKIICLFFLFGLTPQALSCDEECRKQLAEAKYSVDFPGYLTRKYCNDIAGEFMTTSMKSLQSYRFKHLESKHRGGMRNTGRFIEQRKEWLAECDQYLKYTDYGRLFKDAETTDRIFAAMTSVSVELASLVEGATYTDEAGDASTQVAAEKFDLLFKLVDNHKTLLQIRGQFVTRH